MSSAVGEFEFDRSLKVVQRQCGPDTLKNSGECAFEISKSLGPNESFFFCRVSTE